MNTSWTLNPAQLATFWECSEKLVCSANEYSACNFWHSFLETISSALKSGSLNLDYGACTVKLTADGTQFEESIKSFIAHFVSSGMNPSQISTCAFIPVLSSVSYFGRRVTSPSTGFNPSTHSRSRMHCRCLNGESTGASLSASTNMCFCTRARSHWVTEL